MAVPAPFHPDAIVINIGQDVISKNIFHEFLECARQGMADFRVACNENLECARQRMADFCEAGYRGAVKAGTAYWDSKKPWTRVAVGVVIGDIAYTFIFNYSAIAALCGSGITAIVAWGKELWFASPEEFGTIFYTGLRRLPVFLKDIAAVLNIKHFPRYLAAGVAAIGADVTRELYNIRAMKQQNLDLLRQNRDLERTILDNERTILDNERTNRDLERTIRDNERTNSDNEVLQRVQRLRNEDPETYARLFHGGAAPAANDEHPEVHQVVAVEVPQAERLVVDGVAAPAANDEV